MKLLVALVLFVASTQAKSANGHQRLLPSHVASNPRLASKLPDADYAAVEVKIQESTSGLVFGTKPQLGDADRAGTNITGVTAASQGQIPWQAFIVLGGTGLCGGALISTEWIITAAHCLQGINDFHITLGAARRTAAQSGAISQSGRQAVVRYEYNDRNLANNIGALRLTSAVTLTSGINVVGTPPFMMNPITFAGLSALASGYRMMTNNSTVVSEDLLFGEVEIITNIECASIIGSRLLQTTNMCVRGANGWNPCVGESGGPLVFRLSDGGYMLVGVLSYEEWNCATNNAPTTYTRVTSYFSWISSTTGVTGM